MKKKKERTVLLHLFFVILMVAGVTILYNNPHYGDGLKWLMDETYEDTPDFTRQFKTDVDGIFNYIKYKEVFETDGKLDYKKPVVRVTTGPGEDVTYTVDEMIRIAKSMGYYLNENFKVDGRYTPDDGFAQDVRVDWRSYDPDRQDTGPGDSYTTMDQLSREVLGHLGNYYAFHYKFIQNPSNFKFRVSFQNGAEPPELYTNISLENPDDIKALGKYVSVHGDSLSIDTNLNTTLKTVSAQLEQCNPYNNSSYYMVAAVNTSYPDWDSYAQAARAYEHMRLLFITGLVALAAGILGWAFSLYSLGCLAGRQKPHGAVCLGRIDRIPTESCLILFAAGTMCILFLGEHIGYKLIHLVFSEEQWYYGELMVRLLILYAMGITAFFSVLRRYKAGTLWSGSIVRSVLISLRLYLKNHRFTTRLILGYGLYLAVNCGLLLSAAILYFTYHNVESRILIGLLTLSLICLDSWVFHQLYRNAWETDQINEALFNISHGDTTYEIDAEEFYGKERELAEHINHISRGLETALQEKVRSERLKADLITNVSHDIKTPLTSIINYVGLIRRERPENPKIQSYLDVLEQKSQRLKTLTEDLVEASKASSGNLKLEMADIDFVELIHQTNGEFEEKFSGRRLELVSRLPEETIVIKSDGRHLWRVLENLYNNAFKYAMEHSRIYVDVWSNDGRAYFTIKNVSDSPLNINADELTERFVRGDVARATEGSGLGLSIAKSLTELLAGEFTIFIDGDLFKVELNFPGQDRDTP